MSEGLRVKTCENCRHAQTCEDRDWYSVCRTACERWASMASKGMEELEQLKASLDEQYQSSLDPACYWVKYGIAMAIDVLSGHDTSEAIADLELELGGRYQTFDPD